MSLLEFVGGSVGTALGGPGGGAVGAAAGNKLPGILTNLFGGAGRDAQRQARADWFTEQALAGSPLAARVLLGGVVNTGGNEAPMYTRAIETVRQRRPDVMNEAYNRGGQWWDSTDNASSDKMRAAVNAELATQTATSAAAPGVVTLPLMTTSASALPASSSSSLVVVLLLVVVAAIGLAFALKRGG